MADLNFMKTPDDLEGLSRDLGLEIHKTLYTIHQNLDHQKVYERFPELASGMRQEDSSILLTNRYFAGLEEKGGVKFSAATASTQSGGKSTASNMILGYPLLPTAVNTTTACPTEIRYSEQPSIHIRYYGDQSGEFIDGPGFQGSHKLKPDLWRGLLEYACLCISQEIILPETLQYYADKNLARKDDPPVWSDLQMSPDDPRQVVQLLLVLFSTYVGQNHSKPDQKTARVCGEREKLLKTFGVKPDKDFCIQVGWNHPALKRGLILIDLPGFGSSASERSTAEGKIKRSHDDISLEYLQNADVVFLFFSPEALAGNIPKILETLLKGERMKCVVSKENRIIPILNKVDISGAEAQIPFTTTQIRAILGEDLNPPAVYPIAAISGEYRFLEAGLFPVQRTQAYQREHENYRSEYWEDNGVQPSEEQVCLRFTNRLKKAYEHPYPFKDVDGGSHTISLGQWIQLMTTDYLDIMHVLKRMELLHMGLRVNWVIAEKINGQIAMLRMLKDGGKDLTKKLIDSLENTVKESLQAFGQQVQDTQYRISAAITDLALEKGEAVQKSYEKAFRSIEDKIMDKIQSQVDKMQANGAGNYIMDPDECILEKMKQRARTNRAAYDQMLKEVKEFNIASCLQDSEDKLKEMIQSVQQDYEKGLRELTDPYHSMAKELEKALDRGYHEAMQSVAGTGTEDGKREQEREQFDRIYGGLYQQLKTSILTQVEQFAKAAITTLYEYEGVSNCQKEAVNAAMALSVAHQERYRDASKRYVESLQGKAIIAEHAFNMEGFQETVKVPFFPARQQELWAAEAIELFTGSYSRKIDGCLITLGNNMNSLNRSGMLGSVNGLGSFIEQKIGLGDMSIEAEITGLEYDKKELILKQVQELMDRTAGKFETLREYDWAAAEIGEIESLRRQLAAAVTG